MRHLYKTFPGVKSPALPFYLDQLLCSWWRYCCISCYWPETMFLGVGQASRCSILLLSSLFLIPSDHLVYPGCECRHFGVDSRGLLCSAGMAPGRDPINHPAPSRALAHQRAAAVASAAVYSPVWLKAAGTEHPGREGAVKVMLAVSAGKEVDGSLLQGLGVGAAYEG